MTRTSGIIAVVKILCYSPAICSPFCYPVRLNVWKGRHSRKRWNELQWTSGRNIYFMGTCQKFALRSTPGSFKLKILNTYWGIRDWPTQIHTTPDLMTFPQSQIQFAIEKGTNLTWVVVVESRPARNNTDPFQRLIFVRALVLGSDVGVQLFQKNEHPMNLCEPAVEIAMCRVTNSIPDAPSLYKKKLPNISR